jgi:hypothetical protein
MQPMRTRPIPLWLRVTPDLPVCTNVSASLGLRISSYHHHPSRSIMHPTANTLDEWTFKHDSTPSSECTKTTVTVLNMPAHHSQPACDCHERCAAAPLPCNPHTAKLTSSAHAADSNAMKKNDSNFLHRVHPLPGPIERERRYRKNSWRHSGEVLRISPSSTSPHLVYPYSQVSPNPH